MTRVLYLSLWGKTYCRSCLGRGEWRESYDPSPSGVGLSPGSMWDVGPCGCIDHELPRCPRCGACTTRLARASRWLRAFMDALEARWTRYYVRSLRTWDRDLGRWPRNWRRWLSPTFRSWWGWLQLHKCKDTVERALKALARPLARWSALPDEEEPRCLACGWVSGAGGLPERAECGCVMDPNEASWRGEKS